MTVQSQGTFTHRPRFQRPGTKIKADLDKVRWESKFRTLDTGHIRMTFSSSELERQKTWSSRPNSEDGINKNQGTKNNNYHKTKKSKNHKTKYSGDLNNEHLNNGNI